MPFDIEGAKAAGYSDAEIADHLAQTSKFDAASARKSGYSDTEIIQHLSPPQTSVQPVQQESSLFGDIKRGAGLAARNVIQGAGAIPIALTDAAGRMVMGDKYQPVSQTLTDAGLPQPQTNAERLVSAAGEGGASALTGVGVGSVLANSARPAMAAAGDLLAASPVVQVASGAGAGVGSESARQAGYGQAAQMGAGLLGGIAGGGLANAVLPKAPALTEAAGNASLSGTAAADTPISIQATKDIAAQSGRTSEYKAAVLALDKEKIPLTKGQRSGTNYIKSTERTLSEIPFSGKPLQGVFENQQQAYQKSLLKMAGNQQGDSMITRQTLDNTGNDLSKEYTKALGGKSVDIADDDFLNHLGEIEAKHSQFVDDPSKLKVKQIVNSFLDEAQKSNTVTGEWYQKQRSLFAKRSQKNTDVADLYGDLKTLLDDAFTRSAGDVKGGLDSRYARYKQLQNIYERNGGPAASEGFISPVAVAKEAAGSPGGREWQDFTRAAAAVMPDRLGNSGTAQRNFILKTLGIGASGGTVPALIMNPAATLMAGGGVAASAAAARGLSSHLAKQSTGQPLLQSIIQPSLQGILQQQSN